MNVLFQDLRYAARTFLRNPGFTAVAVLILALGIGASTAIFSYVNSFFLRPLSLAEPDRVVRVFGATQDGRLSTISYPTYLDLRDRARTLAGLAAHQYTTLDVGLNAAGGDATAALQGEIVTGNYFSLLGANALAGRNWGSRIGDL